MSARGSGSGLRVELLRDNPTIRYAGEELAKYLTQMCGVDCTVRTASGDAADTIPALRLGLHEDLGIEAPPSDAPDLDDAIQIAVEKGVGSIAGRNPRSVLLGVYRFLEEAGCRWLRPGPDGEVVPARNIADISVSMCDVPSYRHRGLCIEGAVSFENMVDSVEWAPKVGLNSYMLEFLVPYTFFDRWYSHPNNPHKEPETVSVADIARFTERIVEEIDMRGLTYHAMGHGWTCEPFGIPGLEWVSGEFQVEPDVSQLFAEIDGKRVLHEGIPLNTNLCYSNPAARAAVVDYAVEYARAHPEVGMLHVWLADNYNNHCECVDCVDSLPSDLYVQLLNEMDEAFTTNGIDMRIAFIAYLELLWPPEHHRLSNPDRFSLLFAPISRSYSRPYDVDTAGVALPAYVRNRIQLPSDISQNLAYLHAWQRWFKGDAFTYEYYFMWDHYFDPAYYQTAKVLCEDVKRLRDAGLNGIISDQTQRAYFPTGFGMDVMAKTLWDASVSFDDLAAEYFAAAFGEDGEACRRYMETLSTLFNPPYVRGDVEPTDGASEDGDPISWRRGGTHRAINDAAASSFSRIPAVVGAFRPTIARNVSAHEGAVGDSWRYLAHHAEVATGLSGALQARAEGNWREAASLWEEVADYVQRNEDDLQPVLDVFLFVSSLGRLFRHDDEL